MNDVTTNIQQKKIDVKLEKKYINVQMQNYGTRGIPGKSAYEVAVENGYVGTEEEWLASLVGPEGPEGPEGPSGPANTLSIGTVTKGDDADATITGTSPNQTLNLTLPKGDKGDTGDTGATGPAGRGVSTVTKTGTVGLVDTYTMAFTDGTSTTYNVTNGDTPHYTAGVGIDITGNVISNTQTSAEWGNITGTMSDQTDLTNALAGKADTSDIPDLTNYVTNTDYATSSTGGVLKIDQNYGLRVSSGTLIGYGVNYTDYQSALNQLVVDKGTLENVITGKGLVSNTDFATASTGGVLKISASYGTDTVDGVLTGYSKTYAEYNNANNYLLISKGTLGNVLIGKGLNHAVKSTDDTVTNIKAMTQAEYDVLTDTEKNTGTYLITDPTDDSYIDELPIGSIIEYDGDTVPDGWELVDEEITVEEETISSLTLNGNTCIYEELSSVTKTGYTLIDISVTLTGPGNGYILASAKNNGLITLLNTSSTAREGISIIAKKIFLKN